ncbi:MAG: ImmA/IrrE family metallo-endopeptidase [Gammaproteobacteria bacterium]|nr:ImmA/IrrE family metallo-endopeptidase [Gammaproteobacteria bacterium]
MKLSKAKAIVKLHQRNIPVDVEELAWALGATVYDVSGWPDEKSGMIRIDKEDGGSRGYVIYVNADHHINRQRFTIAHEIAHIMLHDYLIGDGIITNGLYRSGLPTSAEWGANRTAADILMPWEWIHRLLDRGVTDVRELARRFQVSRDAMAIRLDMQWELQHWSDPPYRTGHPCPQTGHYSSDCHVADVLLKKGGILPSCLKCHKPTNWTLVRSVRD